MTNYFHNLFAGATYLKYTDEVLRKSEWEIFDRSFEDILQNIRVSAEDLICARLDHVGLSFSLILYNLFDKNQALYPIRELLACFKNLNMLVDIENSLLRAERSFKIWCCFRNSYIFR